ncbi:Serine/threonine-protein phosphatase 7 inactive like [Dissostichus eleginoides]|uniref:Serine/threonine-protein phosphatase 7 inactive like n=1 Tax=Dissostichus eleginoides TaxID=100907 RepID=A0AAD9C597_DISEL|nr:Serine/threonine-protein phosphatase 7 inactive like [Dissostichus eleginoides]
MLEQFEKTWPEVFYNTISSKVKTMATTTKSIKIGDSKIYDLNVIYSRTIVLFSSDRDVDVKDVLAYELAPVPTAMFTEDGMRICKAKSTLKKSLQVEVSRRNAGDADVTVIDGSALLWTIHWPADGTVADFIDNVKTRLISCCQRVTSTSSLTDTMITVSSLSPEMSGRQWSIGNIISSYQLSYQPRRLSCHPLKT